MINEHRKTSRLRYARTLLNLCTYVSLVITIGRILKVIELQFRMQSALALPRNPRRDTGAWSE